MRLPAAYVARHVELGWAVTGYGTQGDTTDDAICVVEPSSTRSGVYVGMTRGRGRNLGLVVDPTGMADPEEAFAAVIARPPNATTALAVAERLGSPVVARVTTPVAKPLPGGRPVPPSRPPPTPEPTPAPVPEHDDDPAARALMHLQALDARAAKPRKLRR